MYCNLFIGDLIWEKITEVKGRAAFTSKMSA